MSEALASSKIPAVQRTMHCYVWNKRSDEQHCTSSMMPAIVIVLCAA